MYSSLSFTFPYSPHHNVRFTISPPKKLPDLTISDWLPSSQNRAKPIIAAKEHKSLCCISASAFVRGPAGINSHSSPPPLYMILPLSRKLFSPYSTHQRILYCYTHIYLLDQAWPGKNKGAKKCSVDTSRKMKKIPQAKVQAHELEHVLELNLLNIKYINYTLNE